jgi:hypothetical protein
VPYVAVPQPNCQSMQSKCLRCGARPRRIGADEAKAMSRRFPLPWQVIEHAESFESHRRYFGNRRASESLKFQSAALSYTFRTKAPVRTMKPIGFQRRKLHSTCSCACMRRNRRRSSENGNRHRSRACRHSPVWSLNRLVCTGSKQLEGRRAYQCRRPS